MRFVCVYPGKPYVMRTKYPHKKANIQNPWTCCLVPKKCWVVLTQFWVKYGQTQTLGKKCNLKC